MSISAPIPLPVQPLIDDARIAIDILEQPPFHESDRLKKALEKTREIFQTLCALAGQESPCPIEPRKLGGAVQVARSFIALKSREFDRQQREVLDVAFNALTRVGKSLGDYLAVGKDCIEVALLLSSVGNELEKLRVQIDSEVSILGYKDAKAIVPTLVAKFAERVKNLNDDSSKITFGPQVCFLDDAQTVEISLQVLTDVKIRV